MRTSFALACTLSSDSHRTASDSPSLLEQNLEQHRTAPGTLTPAVIGQHPCHLDPARILSCGRTQALLRSSLPVAPLVQTASVTQSVSSGERSGMLRGRFRARKLAHQGRGGTNWKTSHIPQGLRPPHRETAVQTAQRPSAGASTLIHLAHCLAASAKAVPAGASPLVNLCMQALALAAAGCCIGGL